MSTRLTVSPPCHRWDMKNQLALLQVDRPWELDERTREIGRRGLEQARDALRQAGPARRQAA